MTPEEKIHQHTWWFLAKLQYFYLVAPFGGDQLKDRCVRFVLDSSESQDEKIPTIDEANRLAYGLQLRGVLKNEEKPKIEGSKIIFTIDILQPKFNGLYNLYKNSLVEKVDAVELTRMVNEWAHPVGNDAKLTYRIWELVNGKTADKKQPVQNERAATDQAAEDKKKFPHKLPAGTKWENFTITFIDDETVHISVRGINQKANYRDMGFEDKRNSKPNSQWLFLKILAKYGGEINWKTSEADEKFKKWKERLTEQLKDYFPLEFDPFKPYQDTKSYKTKFTLILPQTTETAKPVPHPSRDEIQQEVEELFNGLVVAE